MAARSIKRKCKEWLKSALRSRSQEVNALYSILYNQCHNLEQAVELTPNATLTSFSHQWSELPEGKFLLSDPFFRDQVDTILSSQELLLRKSWFQGKKVLDAGCGNGRWAYGFSKLGADLTCVDGNLSALEATRKAISSFANSQDFIHTPLERLDEKIEAGTFDLAFSWGVVHHCVSFKRSLENVARSVKEGGLIYLYLYGRESLSLPEDITLFKDRVAYNALFDTEQRERFLLRKAGGDPNKVHNVHDIYAPLINRRFHFKEVASMLSQLGFSQIVRTIDHTELFIRAVKGEGDYTADSLPPHTPPYWFQQ